MALISLAIALCIPFGAIAASFDCTQSHLQAEKLVCSDPQLSALDDKLNQAYQAALRTAASTKTVHQQQKNWLVRIRNKCITKQCVSDAYNSRIHQLLVPQPTTATEESRCPLTEAKLQGAWERVTDTGFFEEMDFGREGADRMFNSWLHHRPEIFGGTWKLENCVIYIRHPTEAALSFAFSVAKVKGNRIHLRETGDTSDSIYKRINP